MKVSILGGGPIGLAYYALLTEAGHEPVIYSATGRRTGLLDVDGVVSGTFEPRWVDSLAEAADHAEIVICARCCTGLRALMDELAPLLRADQVLIFSSHASFSALYLSRLLEQRDLEPLIVAWSTTVATARWREGFAIHVDTVRSRVDFGALNEPTPGEALGICRGLFGARFGKAQSLLAVDLSNLNPPIHIANSLANLTRIERGEAWANYDGITPTVGRMIEALDLERLAVATAFGVKVRSVQEHYLKTFDGLDPGSVAEMAAQVYRRGGTTAGPVTLATRFLTEDVPFGLVPLVAVGQACGVPMPLHEAAIRLISVYCGRDFTAENDLLPALADVLSAKHLRTLV
jgi:opine dehydrogenase